MDIDALLVLGSGAIDHFRNEFFKWMRSELAICASGSSTEEDKQAYTRLQSCLQAQIIFEGSQIKAEFEVNRENLTADFLKKHSGLIDGFEANIGIKNQFFLETIIPDYIDDQKLTEYLEPFLYQQIISQFGGEVSA